MIAVTGRHSWGTLLSLNLQLASTDLVGDKSPCGQCWERMMH